jgi:hypothetical protein
MDETKVASSDDILMAADERLHAPIEPITKKISPAARSAPAESETVTEDEPGESEEGKEGDEPEASYEIDGERLTASQIREARQHATRVREAEDAIRTSQYLLQHPEEYERVRREHGLAPATAPAPTERPANRGPDPVEDPNGWKYARFNQYIAALQQRGQTATAEAITAQVEQDHVHARTDRMHEQLMEERQQRARDRQEQEKAQAQWRQDQEAQQIDRTLTPLFKKYPAAATQKGQELVEALIVRAIHLGRPFDYESIVREVSETRKGIIREYSQAKKAMASGTSVASGRGGSAQGTRAKLADTMPADVSSISEYAERRSRGE